MANEHITRREAKERIDELEDALETLLEIAIYYPEKRVIRCGVDLILNWRVTNEFSA